MELNSNKRWHPLQFLFDLRRRPSLGWREILAKDVLTKDSSGKRIARPLPFVSPSSHSLTRHRKLSDIPESARFAGRKNDLASDP
jgi:hypothetical protein